MSTKLDSAQNDWVEAKVKEGFEASKEVNSVLLGETGVPPIPEIDAVIRQSQEQLANTKSSIDFMMNAEKDGNPTFSYQTTLVSPSDRLDLIKKLLDAQPKTMASGAKPQEDTWIFEPVEKHLSSRPSIVAAPAWSWEFVNGERIIDSPEGIEDCFVTLSELSRKWSSNLPRMMRGTDRFTWATLMASGLRTGEPLDVLIKNVSIAMLRRSVGIGPTFRRPGLKTDKTMIREQASHCFTVLNEEGSFGHSIFDDDTFVVQRMVNGQFDNEINRAILSACDSERPSPENAVFRASIRGVIY